MIYRIIHILLRLLLRISHRLKIYNADFVPKFGGVIIAANHISLADPPVLGTALNRESFFMAKYELFKIPIFNLLIKRLHAFPVKRDAIDLKSFRTAKKLLDTGNAVVIFPQGRREKISKLNTIKPGICLLAKITNSPIIPAFIFNSNEMMKFKPIKVAFGKPIYIKNKRDTSIIINAINLLRDEYKDC